MYPFDDVVMKYVCLECVIRSGSTLAKVNGSIPDDIKAKAV